MLERLVSFLGEVLLHFLQLSFQVLLQLLKCHLIPNQVGLVRDFEQKIGELFGSLVQQHVPEIRGEVVKSRKHLEDLFHLWIQGSDRGVVDREIVDFRSIVHVFECLQLLDNRFLLGVEQIVDQNNEELPDLVYCFWLDFIYQKRN